MNFIYLFFIIYFNKIITILTYPKLSSNFLTITVKTTSKNYNTRIQDILDTWFRKLPNNIWFVSDYDDEDISNVSGNHLISTECGRQHKITDLVCKMQKELEVFAFHNSLWSCHFDDDNYVNIDQLIKFLQTFNSNLPYFFGKRSIKNPLYINNFNLKYATGGAGFCISNAILSTIKNDIKNGNYLETALNNRLPDDMAFSYFIEYNYNFPLTVVSNFHSHLEISSEILDPSNEISLSFNNIQTDNQKFKFIIPDYCIYQDDERLMKTIHCLIEKNNQNMKY
ncbi:Fringe glycosyltransferase [Strongyloides ratti]|uniref:Fringe glycosyltransferase n=1 Tax=Strongyloides ratti TaxID=34506 RepID=A0A090LHD4_STRRB|nr:Fringe glycosyltransferase [Strongyloides ratti]CEF66905.1 Fringe glycosyltransferase [Strongyloides ratti]